MLYRTLAIVGITFVVLAASTEVSTRSYLPQVKLRPFPNIIARSYSHIEGASVSIKFGYQKDFDRLLFEYTGDGIVGSFNPDTGILNMHGRASTQAYVDAIKSVSFVTKAIDGKARQLSWTYGNSTIYNPDTEHFYTMFWRRGLMWEDAVKVCAQTKFFDMQGYLATITTEDEFQEVVQSFSTDAWIGASDMMADGEWRWVTGPEGMEKNGTGRRFWTGLSTFAGGSSYKGSFAGWARFQPDNERNEQHYLSLRFSAAGSGFYDDSMNAIQDGYLCEYGGLDNSAIASHYAYYQGAVTLLPGCELITKKDDCVNSKNLGCAWSPSGVCQIASCLAFKNEKDCDANWNCIYNAEAFPPICENTRCSAYSNKESCEADTRCIVQNPGSSTVQCVPAKCGDLPKSSICNSIEGTPCTYDTANSKCVQNEFADCPAMDIAFLVDASIGMDDSFGRHPSGYPAVLEILREYFHDAPTTLTASGAPMTNANFGLRVSLTQFGPAAPPTNPAFSSLPTGIFSAFSRIVSWNEDAFAKSRTNMLRGALEMAIGNLSSTQAPRKKVVVIISESVIDDADAVKGVLGRFSDVSAFGIVLRRSEVQGVPDHTAELSLLTILNGATSRVANVQIRELLSILESLCDRTSEFGSSLVNKNIPSNFCGNFITRDSCTLRPRCGWDASSQTCVNSHCTLYNSTAACAADVVCQPSANENCDRVVCDNLKSTQATCEGKPGACIWSLGTCVSKPCVASPFEDACEAEPDGCVYNPVTSPKCQLIKCQSNDQGICLRDSACAWNGEKCYIDLCKTYSSNRAGCIAQPQCLWSTALNQCTETYCAKIQDEKKCDEDYACEWNVKTVPAVCSPQACGYYNLDATTAQRNCVNDTKCFWEPIEINKQKSQCIDKTCKTQTKSCDCLLLPQCVWRDNQCRENRFVQCPAIDLVFLLEGSTAMTKTFGRHPNGYAALVQSIRSWARGAPVALDPDSPGFRIAVVQYAPPKVPGVVSRDVGGGGNVTGNLQKILAELEWHDNNLIGKQYAGTSMFLQPALQTAGKIFANSPKPKTAYRTKIIMMMGFSPIADGTAIANDVNALRNMGVSIFSNHIRRFEAITPTDKIAASMLLPLASDPQSTHFRYATVDNVDDMVLQKFCDPTTPVGIALSISKSGDIPCGWLSSKEECGAQNFCQWDPNAVPTCPESDQCPNLECQSLPSALVAQGFTCKNCKLTNGAMECSKTNSIEPVKGGCVVSSCSTNCVCPTTATCQLSTADNLCTRVMCSGYMSSDSCNADYGCVWDPSNTKCVVNDCAEFREFLTCDSQVIVSNSWKIPKCQWKSDTKCEKPPCAPLCVRHFCTFYGSDDAKCITDPFCSFEVGANSCRSKICDYTVSTACDESCTVSKCSSDPLCYWNPFEPSKTDPTKNGICKGKDINCVLSPFGEWSKPSSNCGSCFQTRSKKILQQPLEGGAACDTPDKLTEQRACIPAVNPDCAAYCSSKKSAECAQDSSCYFNNVCLPRQLGGCEDKKQEDCKDGCKIIEGKCVDSVDVCSYDDSETCEKLSCNWIEGSPAPNTKLYNPGDPATSLFTKGQISGSTEIDGMVIYIQTNYQRGKDYLMFTSAEKKIIGRFVVGTGVLSLYGKASADEYDEALSNVMFYTSSTSQLPRVISWSVGADTFYHSETGHHYRYFPTAGGWLSARNSCSQQKLFDTYTGYLASVSSEAESGLLTSKMGAEGWLAGSDSTEEGMWRWIGGPLDGQDFWMGSSASKGGKPVNNMFAKWEPPTAENQAGEPSNTVDVASGPAGEDFLYLKMNGFWSDRSSNFIGTGYICEFIGLSSDNTPPYPLGGSTTISPAGCFPRPCVWHTTSDKCNKDLECMWMSDASTCMVRCEVQSTASDCSLRSDVCRWDTEQSPPACTLDKCGPLGMTKCVSESICRWDGVIGRCVYRTGCERLPEATCELNGNGACKFDPNSGLCINKPCDTYPNKIACTQQPLCQWKDTQVNGETKSICIQKTCEHVDDRGCSADPKCNWLSPSRAFLGVPPGGSVVQPFMNTTYGPNSASINVDGATVSISEGSEPESDVLSCDPSDCPPGILDVKFVSPTLYLRVVGTTPMNAIRMYQYVQLVKFRTTSNSPRRRMITFALGNNMVFVSPSSAGGNGYFFKFFDVKVTDKNSAQAVCNNQFFGLNGFLATVKYERDTIALRLLNARGIIAASDNVATSTWFWSEPNGVTTDFWMNYGSLGEPKKDSTGANMYAQWDLGQPTRTVANSDGSREAQQAYLQQSGKWTSIAWSQVRAIPSGVVCRYGDGVAIPTTNAGGVRGVQPSGCFPRVCAQIASESECRKNYLCNWRDDVCVSDERCGLNSNPGDCNQVLNCFWDYDQSSCIPGKRTMCNELTEKNYCEDPFFASSCEWNSRLKPEACTPRGCTKYPFKSVCVNDALCRWLSKEGLCVPRLCGYMKEDQCWSDKNCIFDHLDPVKTCARNPCVGDTTCSKYQCVKNGTDCVYQRCRISDKANCTLDPACVWKDGACTQPKCDSPNLINQKACDDSKECFFDGNSKSCQADQCVMITTETPCKSDETCTWDLNQASCRHKTVVELRAPAEGTVNCPVKEEPQNPWWLWLLLALILIGLGGVLWRLYLAYKHGYSFTDPARYNKKFSAQEMYAKELHDVANDRELNDEDIAQQSLLADGGAQRPSLNDL